MLKQSKLIQKACYLMRTQQNIQKNKKNFKTSVEGVEKGSGSHWSLFMSFAFLDLLCNRSRHETKLNRVTPAVLKVQTFNF